MIYLWMPIIFFAGLILGRFLFTDTRPRDLLTLHLTRHGWDANQLAGLIASVLVRKAPGLIPNVILETDKILVFEHPRPKFKHHYLLVPKKDIKNIGELSAEDMAYLTDLFTVLGEMIRSQHLKRYRLWTNGPGKQDVAYLHFHLGSDD